jgi:hypothetical protein
MLRDFEGMINQPHVLAICNSLKKRTSFETGLFMGFGGTVDTLRTWH